jgi:malate dehydrogenase (oxaloacetate-decarboxylating)
MADVEKYSHKIVRKIRFKIPDVPGALGFLARALGAEGVILGDIIKIQLTSKHIIRDITAFFDNENHFDRAIAAMKKLKAYKIMQVQDEILNLHKGGKIEMCPRVKVETLSDLRMIYTPGVAQVCKHIVAHPEDARKYTSIGNTVCIATNGSAVLGLGNIGILPGMPVMEGKSLILHKMGGVSCIPLLLNSDSAKEIVDALACIAPTFGAIMIEDIGAPLCFEVEEELQKRVPIPVFHDDQHGTAIVILAGLIKSLKLTGKKIESVSVVVNGAGSAGIAATKLMLNYGVKNIVLCDSKGALYQGRKDGMNPFKNAIVQVTNKRCEKGALADVIRGKDVFIGVSAQNVVTQAMVKSMAARPIIFALANPIPEIWPDDAKEAGASIALDGRTINNALAFPGLLRGTLDAGASRITVEMKCAAAKTIAALAHKYEVVPDFMNSDVHKKVAKAVALAASGG